MKDIPADVRAKGAKLHRRLRDQLIDAIQTSIELLETIDEKTTLVQLLGTITSETHDLLKDAKE